MIRINLLGESAVQDNSGKIFVIAYGGSVALLIVVLLAVQQLIASGVSDLTMERDQLKKQLAALEEQTTEVRDLEKRKLELDEKLGVIAKLKLSKKGPVRVLDEINVAIPEKVWINDMKEVKGQLSISGIALDNPSIVEFMKNLERSPYFLEVNLKETAQAFMVRQRGRSRQSSSAKTSKPGKGSGSDLDAPYTLKRYDDLSPEEQQAFDTDKPGYGNRVRSFTLQCTISYMGLPKVAALVQEPADSKTEGKKS
ncbi:MAG: PilN domain-containing protein [Bdellovibrionota bacterium]|nr:MAG: PilN domain-containing protein [Bdellovibrionota bacterium]